MSYNIHELPRYINTAGKITVVTALFGVVVFMVAFLLNIGAKELQQADAQGYATTTVTVLNTPPQWTVDAQEENESSTSTPTNSGDVVSWVAVGTDSNSEDYYLLICSSASAPSSTPNGAPTCNGGTQWAVSTATISGTQARAATTTTEAFVESNDWYAWICDGIAVGPRCNAVSKQGTSTTASPFNVNHRPSFTAFSDNSETINALPGDTVTFYATSTDPDVVDSADTMQLIVCSTTAFSTTTNTCGAETLGTSTFSNSSTNPKTATYSVTIPTRDTTYGAYGFVIDEHGHEALGGQQGQNSVLTVYNATPTVSAAQITLNNGTDLVLSQEAGETTGFTLQFIASDNNSCENASAGDEIVDYNVVVYRSGIGTSTCDSTGANYNANNCYDSSVPTTTWNMVCTASSTSCTYGVDGIDKTMVFDCTFPLWYIADPTEDAATSTPYWAENWRAAVAPIDDNNATGTLTEGSTGQNLLSFLSFSLDTLAIPYGPLEPGQQTDPLVASTTLRATGNVGLDQLLSGESMCKDYTSAVTCTNSSTSTIAEYNQVFATSTISYASATSSGNTISSSTQKELELNIFKPTSTSTQTSGVTYWGIRIPSSITLAGVYTGENTIWGKVGEPAQWGP